MVLQYQSNVLPDLAEHVTRELGGKKSPEASEIERRKKEQLKIIDVHIKDVARMDTQASSIYMSLTHLLDLKQKHANAFEARFARDQAQLTAKQGQTILVFTIVTIIFLPMSFIAAFFAINMKDFQQDGSTTLSLAYVSKYMFGIGFAISIPLIIVALAVDDVGIFIRKARDFLGNHVLRRKPLPEHTELEKRVQATLLEQPRYSNVEKYMPLDEGMDGRISRNYGIEEQELSPSGLRPRTRRGSENKGTQVSWAMRASFDKVRGRISQDLERGRGAG
jgi:hypothetical protein